ncbi:MAG TPA: hypothetical protein VND93_02985, partial [Myxococcales bacterium]|nr:hypothetical protein [Myxococcales bacterium]
MTGQARRPFVRLEELLLRHGAITQEQLQKAKEEQQKWGGDLGRLFVELGYVSEELLLRATAHQMGTKFMDPANEQLDPELVRLLTSQLCEQFGVIAVAGDPKKKVLRVATSDPQNQEVLAHLGRHTGFTIELYVATSASIHAAIRRHYYGEGPPGPVVHDTAPRGVPATGAASAAAAAGPSAPAPAPAPALPPTAGVGSAELEALEKRVARLEQYLGSLRQDLAHQISTDPQLAGLAARLENLEQVSTSDVGSLRAVVELLLEHGVFKLDDLKAKVKTVRERSGPGS